MGKPVFSSHSFNKITKKTLEISVFSFILIQTDPLFCLSRDEGA